MRLIYFDASFSNFKIGKRCWNSSRIWMQIPHEWYWNHPLPAFREGFFCLTLWIKGWVRNLNKVWQCWGSQTFAALDLCASVQIHTWHVTLPPHCSISWSSVPGAPNSRRNARAPNTLLFSEMKMEMMSFEEDAVHKSWRGHSPWSTYTSQPRALHWFCPSKESLSKIMIQSHKIWMPLPDSEWWSQVELPFGFLAILLTLV